MRYAQSLKLWKTIAKPKKSLLFWQFLTDVIPALLELFLTILSANLIGSLSVFDYYSAKQFLIYSIATLSICFLFWNINYFLYPKQLRHIYSTINLKIFDKILKTNNHSLRHASKEKMINIIGSNLLTLAEFSNTFSKKITHLLSSLISLAIIFYYNTFLGLFCVFTALSSFLLYSLFTALRSKQINRLQESKDELLEFFGNAVDGRNLFADPNIVSKFKEKYLSSVKNISKNHKKEHLLDLLSEKYIYFFWTTLILVITFYLIGLIQNYNLSLTTFLIISPYLSSSILNFFNFLSLFSDLSNATIAAQRMKTILDMDEKELIEFGKNCTDAIDGSIHFNNVSYSNTQKNYSEIFGNLKETSFKLPPNQCTLFQGLKGCGKRSIFYMLKREIKPTTGTITLDNINIYDFDKETFSNNISFATRSPYFFNDTIINNMKYVNKDIKQIKNVFKFLNISDNIYNLPSKLETNLIKDKDLLSSYVIFMLGLARCLLTSSEIIMIYELPIGITQSELLNIKKCFQKIKKNHNIIIFSATNHFPDLVDNHFSVENGTVKKIAGDE